MKRTSLALLLILALLCTGCAAPPSPTALVLRLCEVEASLPVGTLYTYQFTDSVGEEISDAHVQSLFGRGCLPPELDEAMCGAFYLSPTHPFEICVFRAKSRDGVQNLTTLCLSRLELLTRFWSEQGHADYLKNACVAVCGDWVMLAITSDEKEIKKLFRNAV